MGFLKKLFREENRTKKTNETIVENLNRATEELPINNSKTEGSLIEESCEQVIDSMKRLEELKLEYHAVTSYLSDIQKIDGILAEEREEINDIARKIITLTRDRAKYQTSTKKISDSHYKLLASFEDSLPKEIIQMQEKEIYQNKIENDMKHLEGEKSSLFYQKEDVLNSQGNLKKIGIIAGIMALALFLLFTIISVKLEVNTTIPFLMTIVLTLFVAVYIFIETGNNKKDIKLLEAKQNRAIVLLNKVKIKYINNTNALDYAYQKFMVKSYSELQYLYEQYKKAKEEEKRYRSSSEILELTNKELVRILRRYHLEDPEIWIYQAIAIIDSKEMVEVRHRLNVRRQKLREHMDYNTKLREEAVDKIREYLNQRPLEKEQIEPLLRKHGIYL